MDIEELQRVSTKLERERDEALESIKKEFPLPERFHRHNGWGRVEMMYKQQIENLRREKIERDYYFNRGIEDQVRWHGREVQELEDVLCALSKL